MEESCEFLEGCPMFKYFNRSAQKVYSKMYCTGNFARCERRKLRLAGRTVPESLLPYGGRLWNDDELPPVGWLR